MNAEQLQRFAAGEALPVDPDAVERELASLWQSAGQQTEGSAPVTRACLLNVVAILEERPNLEGYGSADRLQAAIDELPRHVAARSLVVRNQRDQEGQQRLESWISANCIIAEGGGKLVCSEEVTIAARGGADRHVPGVARALLVPSLPTCVLYAGIPYGALADPLLQLADRVVSDVDATFHPRPLPPLTRITRDGRHDGMDLGWVGTAALRAEIASIFDPPFEAEHLRAVHGLRCTTPPSVQWSSRILVGWLAHALGADDPQTVGPGQSRLSRPGGGDPLIVSIVVDPEAPGPSFGFTAPGWPGPVTVRCLHNSIEVASPFVPPVRRPRNELTGPAALARSLIYRSEDDAFLRALEIAERLP